MGGAGLLEFFFRGSGRGGIVFGFGPGALNCIRAFSF